MRLATDSRALGDEGARRSRATARAAEVAAVAQQAAYALRDALLRAPLRASRGHERRSRAHRRVRRAGFSGAVRTRRAASSTRDAGPARSDAPHACDAANVEATSAAGSLAGRRAAAAVAARAAQAAMRRVRRARGARRAFANRGGATAAVRSASRQRHGGDALGRRRTSAGLRRRRSAGGSSGERCAQRVGRGDGAARVRRRRVAASGAPPPAERADARAADFPRVSPLARRRRRALAPPTFAPRDRVIGVTLRGARVAKAAAPAANCVQERRRRSRGFAARRLAAR